MRIGTYKLLDTCLRLSAIVGDSLSKRYQNLYKNVLFFFLSLSVLLQFALGFAFDLLLYEYVVVCLDYLIHKYLLYKSFV